MNVQSNQAVGTAGNIQALYSGDVTSAFQTLGFTGDTLTAFQPAWDFVKAIDPSNPVAQILMVDLYRVITLAGAAGPSINH